MTVKWFIKKAVDFFLRNSQRCLWIGLRSFANFKNFLYIGSLAGSKFFSIMVIPIPRFLKVLIQRCVQKSSEQNIFVIWNFNEFNLLII